MRWWLALLVAAPLVASAHPKGFHKRLMIVVARTSVQGVVTMDIDSGERCALLRGGADADRDGLLSDEELEPLKAKLAKLAMGKLSLAVSGYALPVEAGQVKLSLRGDRRASDGALSVAVLFDHQHPHKLSPGMSLEVADVAPDGGHVQAQVFQLPAAGTKQQAPFQGELPARGPLKVRLEALGEAKEPFEGLDPADAGSARMPLPGLPDAPKGR